MNLHEKNPVLKDIPYIAGTFILILIPWIFFRAENVSQAWYILKTIVTSFGHIDMFYPKRIAIIAGLVVFEWIQRKHEHPLHLDFLPTWARYLFYYAIIFTIIMFGTYNYSPFIYFQF